MPELHALDCLQPGIGKLERVKYFNRMLLTAEDMRTDQDFVLQKLRRHNRFLHGWGVVCGLMVKAAPTPTQPWLVQIGEGYALGPFGDEIFVGQTVFMDLASCGPGAATNPCEPALLLAPTPSAGPEVFLAIKYAECRAKPVLAMPAGCGCEDEACEYSRIRDSFSLACLPELPVSHQPDPNAPSLCDIVNGKALLSCMPCPTEPWIVLAKVALPGSRATAIADTAISNKPPIRRVLFSTALLQEQLIKCCCGRPGPHEPEPPPPQAVAKLIIERENSPRVEQRDDRATGQVVGVVQFVMRVVNLGPDPADDVRVQNDITGIPLSEVTTVDNFMVTPTGSWVDTSLPGLEAAFGTIPPGEAAHFGFRVTFKIRQLPQDARIENAAVVKSATPLDPASILTLKLGAPVFT
jgi:hypothetical protein